ncbi:methionine synthase [Nocardioides mangrovicus]|uniref:Methionine synthase n=1 Tax=Nocardioides mangrovicus TaxID=2478913 RepID=A0A3L8P902_9ACTN|nr:methionine synthase [Nocardioides mangrovicus]RLV51088.1 methionine synthase [Nocardioides mangrovicus]
MLASGVGSMPGGAVGEEAQNARAYAEATRVVLGELDLPHVPELPGRGAVAGLVGRTMGLITELGADLQPAGWRLTDASGVDQRRARSLLAQDLDTVEEQAQQVEGWFKTQLCGPWTLAASVERPRGDRVLADVGARRDLAQALAVAVADHVADLRRRVPGAAGLLVQVDEPALPAVLAAQVPTASGFGRHRTVHPPEASEALEWVLSAVSDAGATPVVHCCAADVPVDLLTGAGAVGISVDVGVLAPQAYEGVAGVLESGGWAMLGVVPSLDPPSWDDRAGVAALERFLDMLGLAPSEHTVVTPACGLAGASGTWARTALASCATAAHADDRT